MVSSKDRRARRHTFIYLYHPTIVMPIGSMPVPTKKDPPMDLIIAAKTLLTLRQVLSGGTEKKTKKKTKKKQNEQTREC